MSAHRVLAVSIGAVAALACSRGSLSDDTPDGAIDATRASRTDAGTSTGTGGQSGASGMGGGAATGGAGGFRMCVPGPVTCTEGASVPNWTVPQGSCSIEGERCSGFSCYDGMSGYYWNAVCCEGEWRWMQNAVLTCPAGDAGAEGGAPGGDAGAGRGGAG